MHPTAVRCLQWAVAASVVGAVVTVLGPDLLVLVAHQIPYEATVLGAVDVIVTLVRWTLMPLAGALVGSAVVIQTLAPPPTREPSRSDRATRSATDPEPGPESP